MPRLELARKSPWVIAHRGDSWDRPENTAAAFRSALRARPDGIELDVQYSKDGVPVVYHDESLAKITGDDRRISELSRAELKRLDLGSWFDARFRGERLLTLEESLTLCGGRSWLLVELKHHEPGSGPRRRLELARRAADLIVRSPAAGKAALLSFDEGVLRAAHARAPGIPCVLNLMERLSARALRRERYAVYGAFCIYVGSLTREFVRAVHASGRAALVYGCERPGPTDFALAAGVDGIMSDRPAWLSAYLQRRRKA